MKGLISSDTFLRSKALPGSGNQILPMLSVAVREHGIGLKLLVRDSGPFLIPQGKPTLLVICDDLRGVTGPHRFREQSVRRFLKRVSRFVVLPTREAEGYREVLKEVAGRRRDAIVVETTLRFEPDWIDYLTRLNPSMSRLVGPARH